METVAATACMRRAPRPASARDRGPARSPGHVQRNLLRYLPRRHPGRDLPGVACCAGTAAEPEAAGPEELPEDCRRTAGGLPEDFMARTIQAMACCRCAYSANRNER